jgi:hypothetical protein
MAASFASPGTDVKSTAVAKEEFAHFTRFNAFEELPKQWRHTHAVEIRTQQSAGGGSH